MNLMTWNMWGATDSVENKWTKAVTALFNAGADVVCLQECGGLPGNTTTIMNTPPWNVDSIPYVWYYETWTPISPQKTYTVFMLETNENATRVNIALCTPSTNVVNRLFYAPPGANFGRPSIGFRISGANFNNFNVFTVHANSLTLGADAPALLANIDAAVNQFPGNIPFCAAGDFNRDPTSWNPANAAIIPPAKVTFPSTGLKLDYCVLSPAPAQQVANGQVLEAITNSDHYPVSYIL